MTSTVAELGEDALIDIFAADSGSLGTKVLVPNGDDAAVFAVEPRHAVVVTTDSLVEGVHFDLEYCPPEKVGRKLIAVNLSDIAAMGARPRYVLLSVTVPPGVSVAVLKAIASGVREHAKVYGVRVIGGNTTRTSGPITLSATLLGLIKPEQIIRRQGARVGDGIFVTGHLGDANAGLKLAQAGAIPYDGHPLYPVFAAQIDPRPRVAAGWTLAKLGVVRSMCDVSDGFGRDLGHLLKPAGLGAHIEAHLLPVSTSLRAFAEETGLSPELIALEGGEDYELLFSADPAAEKEIVRALLDVGTPVTRVGTVTATPDIEVFMPDGTVISAPDGFDHFGGGE